jgi:hypothetical protein
LHKLSSLPASDITVSIYLIYVAETAKSILIFWEKNGSPQSY